MTISKERLNILQQTFKATAKTSETLEAAALNDAAAAISELLAVREAQPIGSFHIRDQQVEATTDYVKDGEWPIDNGELLVYAAPPAPAVPDGFVVAH